MATNMMCHLCYHGVPSYQFTDHMKKVHYQDKTILTQLEMSDLEQIAARADVDMFSRMMRLSVYFLMSGAVLVILGGILGSEFPALATRGGGYDTFTVPPFAIAMFVIGGVFASSGLFGIGRFIKWAMDNNIWGRYDTASHRWAQLQNKEDGA